MMHHFEKGTAAFENSFKKKFSKYLSPPESPKDVGTTTHLWIPIYDRHCVSPPLSLSPLSFSNETIICPPSTSSWAAHTPLNVWSPFSSPPPPLGPVHIGDCALSIQGRGGNGNSIMGRGGRRGCQCCSEEAALPHNFCGWEATDASVPTVKDRFLQEVRTKLYYFLGLLGIEYITDF